eukprot:scaffold65452_cov44-Tisochrysis_lutea.AAC.3
MARAVLRSHPTVRFERGGGRPCTRRMWSPHRWLGEADGRPSFYAPRTTPMHRSILHPVIRSACLPASPCTPAGDYISPSQSLL